MTMKIPSQHTAELWHGEIPTPPVTAKEQPPEVATDTD